MIRQHNNLSCYVKHPRHNIQPGSYTDDTQMSLAIAETIVSGEPWKPTVLAHKFVEVFQRDPREGYATGFYHFLLHVRDGEQFLRNIRPTSEKSGAAMRAAPIGIYPTVAKKYNYRLHAERHNNSGSFSCKQASHFWPGDGNSSIAPFAIYGKGLSLKTSDRCISMHFNHSSHPEAARVCCR